MSSMQFNARLDTSHHGPAHSFKDAGVIAASSIMTTNTNGQRRIHPRHQKQFSINMWTGIVDNCLARPLVLSLHLTGNHYRDYLLHDLYT
jgi:hypothetical protein